MGSTGTGRFTDYSEAANISSGGGGSSGEDRCDEAILTALEEVERCPYYKEHGVPSSGTSVVVWIRGRLAVETTTGTLIGYLPTQFNYLAGCISSGRTYSGIVTSTSTDWITTVRVRITPTIL